MGCYEEFFFKKDMASKKEKKSFILSFPKKTAHSKTNVTWQLHTCCKRITMRLLLPPQIGYIQVYPFIFYFLTNTTLDPVHIGLTDEMLLSSVPSWDRYELRSSFEAGVNKVSVRLDNELVPTGQRAIGARLLSPFGNRHYSGQG